MARRVPQSHPKFEGTVLILPGTINLCWGSYETRISSEQLEQGIPVENMEHEPPGSVSGRVDGPGYGAGTTTQDDEYVDRTVVGGERRLLARIRHGTYRHCGNPRIPRGSHTVSSGLSSSGYPASIRFLPSPGKPRRLPCLWQHQRVSAKFGHMYVIRVK